MAADDPTLQDIGVASGDAMFNASNIALLGWQTHKAGSLYLKNPSKTRSAFYDVHDIGLGWLDSGQWKSTQAQELKPGAEAKITVSDGQGKSVILNEWKDTAAAPGGVPDAPPPIATDFDNLVEEAKKAMWLIIIAIIVIAIIAILAVFALGGGQGVAALHGVMS